MLDTELRKNGPPEEFDNTILSNYCECPRQLYWFLRGIEHKVTPAYFIWGRAFGMGLNAFYESEEDHNARSIAGLIAATELWEEEAPEPKTNDTLENLQRVFKEYTSIYRKENWTQKSKHGELGFAFPIPGTSVYYAGSVDAYIEWPGYGILIREDKTTGSYLVPNYQAHWMRTSQVTGYLWAIAQLIGETPFGALINMISKRKSKNTEDQFARNLCAKSQWQLETFIKETVIVIDRIRSEWNSDGWKWPKLGERIYLKCMGGSGKTPCLYNSLCAEECEPWELDETYEYEEEFGLREEKWEPWKRKGEG